MSDSLDARADAVAEALGAMRRARGGRERSHHPHPGMHEHHRAPGPHGPFFPERGGFEGAGPGGPARVRMIAALARASEALTVSELAEAIGVDQPRASRLVQQSVEAGAVERQADPNDARRTRIALTAEGRKFADTVTQRRRTAVRTALESMSEQDQADFVRLLTTFAAAWPSN